MSSPARKEGDAASKMFRYEGYDIVTLQKLIEREYTIPELQSAEEVIGYYARRIPQEVKLPARFSALCAQGPGVSGAKGVWERVDLSEPAMLKAISSNVAQYVTVKTFVEALRKLVLEELGRSLCMPGGRCPRRRRSRGRARRWPLASAFSTSYLATTGS